MLISKFPGYVRERWNRKTHKRDPNCLIYYNLWKKKVCLLMTLYFLRREFNFLQRQVQVVEEQKQVWVVEGRRISRKEIIV